MTPFLAIDFETANPDPTSACALGVALVDSEGVITHTAVHLIRPPTPEFIFTWVHGLTWNDVKGSPTFGEIWPKIVPLLTTAEHLVAHNVPFDKKVLTACLEAIGMKPPSLEWICTLALSKKRWPVVKGSKIGHKLSDVCARLKIQFKDHHEAKADALGCAKILIALRDEEARKRDPNFPPVPVEVKPKAQDPPTPDPVPSGPCRLCGVLLDGFGCCDCIRSRVKASPEYDSLPGETWSNPSALNILNDALDLTPDHRRDVVQCLWTWFENKRAERRGSYEHLGSVRPLTLAIEDED